jgi:DNA-binding MarR family transcriptional regulator
MNYGELLSIFLIDLQSIFRKNVVVKGASFQQLIALSVIPDDGIEMSLLARKIGIDNSTATRLVIGLEKKGWTRRKTPLHDKRVNQVFLTEQGDKVQSELETQFEKIGAAIEKEVNPLDRHETIEYVSSLHWILLKIILNNNKIV